MRYHAPDKLLQRHDFGATVTILVEGDDEELGGAGDAWVFTTWFGAYAREITFHAQGSCVSVRSGVAALRATEPGWAVFGLIDRDVVLPSELPTERANGIHRLPLCTLESYFLDPPQVFRTLQYLAHGRGGLRLGWDSPEAVRDRVEREYEELLIAAAFNRVVAGVTRRFPEYAGAPRFVRNRRDDRIVRLEAELADWGRSCGHPENLGAAYARELGRLQSCGLRKRRVLVDGKMVLDSLLDQFRKNHPVRASTG